MSKSVTPETSLLLAFSGDDRAPQKCSSHHLGLAIFAFTLSILTLVSLGLIVIGSRVVYGHRATRYTTSSADVGYALLATVSALTSCLSYYTFKLVNPMNNTYRYSKCALSECGLSGTTIAWICLSLFVASSSMLAIIFVAWFVPFVAGFFATLGNI